VQGATRLPFDVRASTLTIPTCSSIVQSSTIERLSCRADLRQAGGATAVSDGNRGAWPFPFELQISRVAGIIIAGALK
jgi:hypothetical protein